jgi:hypothetical protein
MTELPDWIDEKIEFDPSNEVQDEHLVEVFLESEEPYLSRKKVASHVAMSKQGAGERLEDLVDIEVLDADSVAGGRIYWIRDVRSGWPIPSDVEVEPVQRQTTLEEFANRLYVKYGFLALALVIMGSLFMMAFTLLVAYSVEVPLIGAVDLLAGGLIFTLFGYSLLVLAISLGSWDRIN